jgi:hypothetical protein
VAAVEASAIKVIAGPPATVYRCLADMGEHHPRLLPPAFQDFQVEAGGIGAGTVVSFTLSAGGRTRRYRMEVAEPEPGKVLTESDTESSLVTTFRVEPHGGGSQVEISTRWEGAGGIGGIFERLFAPKVMSRIYEDELARLDAYVRQLGRAPGGEA